MMIDVAEDIVPTEQQEQAPLVRVRQDGLRLYARQKYTPTQIESFLNLVQKTDDSSALPTAGSSLSGRIPMIAAPVEGIGNVVIKSYRRGGLLGLCLSSTHARVFETRSRLEFKILGDARSMGINAPQPLAYIEKGEFFYQTWLVTRQIEGGINLIEYSKQYPGMMNIALSKLAEELRKLIMHRIHHVDLHPGNVVIVGDAHQVESAWIVDFDKAYHSSGNRNLLRDKYLRRWRRAVIKHGLSEAYSEVISLALREQF